MRTFSRANWQEAQALWREGEFSDEWKPYRHEAAMRGMLYPPTGTKYDGWDEDEPSQRAVLIRAIRETPQALHLAIARSHTWSQVIAILLGQRDAAAEDSRFVDRVEVGHIESAATLKSILDRIGQS